MTPLETANLVPTFIENTLRGVFRPIGAQSKPRWHPELTLVFYFLTFWYLLFAAISGLRIMPGKDHIPNVPKTWHRHPADGTWRGSPSLARAPF